MFISIEQDGRAGTYQVDVKPRDIVAWEAAGRNRTISDLSSPSMTTIYELAHMAAKRTGQTDLSLDAFKCVCDVMVEEAAGDDLVDPTQEKEHTPA